MPAVCPLSLCPSVVRRWPHHEQDQAAQFLIKVAQALKKDKAVQSIQTIGYCYGQRPHPRSAFLRSTPL